MSVLIYFGAVARPYVLAGVAAGAAYFAYTKQ